MRKKLFSSLFCKLIIIEIRTSSKMEDKIQGIYSTPISNPPDPCGSNMYFLQVKPNTGEESLEAEAIPIHMLINEQDPQNDQYLISVLQSKQIQLFIDSRGQASTNSGTCQYYDTPVEPLTIKTEYQIPNVTTIPIQGSVVEHKTEIESKAELLSCHKKSKVTSHGDSQSEKIGLKKKTVQKFVHIPDRVLPPRALGVLPAALRLRRGLVSPRRPLPARARFGPVEGIKRSLKPDAAESLKLEFVKSGMPVFLLKADDGAETYIDVSDKDKSNWISLLPLGEQSTANVWLYQEEDQLYGVTTRSIPARAPLVLGYSKEYVDAHKLPVEQAVLDLDAELASKFRQWWCHECQRSMSTASLLQIHMDVYHSKEKPRPRRYRCRHCTKTFCRLFTLRRHIATHCTKKRREEKDNGTSVNGILDCPKPDDLSDLSINNTTADDSRLPSDESLQTLTNNLDFSTNLFDTDRMPNLDISGSSRSEDFNYSLTNDIGLAGAIDFGIDEPCSKKEVKEVKPDNAEIVYLTCRYCNQAVIRGRQRQHVKVCTGRKFHCECGRVFQYKDKLALHIHVDHKNSARDGGKGKGTKEADELQYKCETCNHNFKRRGMLVNHLWRVHKTASTSVPLEKRVRHYPCVACPKLYRTAAKRDRHVDTHHPGSELARRDIIEGGRLACAPAACSACPRQYATRAKLLQHVRKDHPALAPPVKK